MTTPLSKMTAPPPFRDDNALLDWTSGWRGWMLLCLLLIQDKTQRQLSDRHIFPSNYFHHKSSSFAFDAMNKRLTS